MNKTFINKYNNPIGQKMSEKMENMSDKMTTPNECKHRLTPDSGERLICVHCGETFKF
jgi:hypothetical protein